MLALIVRNIRFDALSHVICKRRTGTTSDRGPTAKRACLPADRAYPITGDIQTAALARMSELPGMRNSRGNIDAGALSNHWNAEVSQVGIYSLLRCVSTSYT